MSSEDELEAYGPHDFSDVGRSYSDPMLNQAMRGIETDAIDFEVEDAKQRTRDMARRNILIEAEIQEVEYHEKRAELKSRQDAVGWRKFISSWFGG